MKKPPVRWGLVGTGPHQVPKRREARLEVGSLGRRLEHSLGRREEWQAWQRWWEWEEG